MTNEIFDGDDSFNVCREVDHILSHFDMSKDVAANMHGTFSTLNKIFDCMSSRRFHLVLPNYHVFAGVQSSRSVLIQVLDFPCAVGFPSHPVSYACLIEN